LPRAAVDSVRLGNPEGAYWKTIGLVFGLPALIYLVICTIHGGGCAMGRD
jgi:hypothetical protein